MIDWHDSGQILSPSVIPFTGRGDLVLLNSSWILVTEAQSAQSRLKYENPPNRSSVGFRVRWLSSPNPLATGRINWGQRNAVD